MAAPIFVVDAFADRPFTGNPAGVCVLETWPSDAWMQSVAAEMRHAETAFLVPEGDGYRLRWFTPAIEVDLCGHATLASAHILFTEHGLTDVAFMTRSGRLTASLTSDGIELDFPSEEPTAADFHLDFLGDDIRWTGRNRMDWFVEIGSAAAVRALNPDFAAIRALGNRGLIVTAKDETGEFDFVSRGFFPAAGIDEDPVTGSAHCALAPYWSPRLERTKMSGYQASERGGVVRVEMNGDRVWLRGNAITTLAGSLRC